VIIHQESNNINKFMKLLESEKFELPKVFFITDRREINEVPVGIPYIFGDPSMEQHIVQLMEYEILYESAMRSGYPFNFRRILSDNGYKGKSFHFSNPAYVKYETSGDIKQTILAGEGGRTVHYGDGLFKQFVHDNAAYVDISKLKSLQVFPTWLKDVEEAISVNINAFATFNPNMYSKKLDGMYGAMEMVSPPRNLIIIDISGSIPKAVSSTCLAMAKNLSESFYADLLITGSKSTLYEYENVSKLDVETIYEENGMDNDQAYFKKLVESEEKNYNTAIVFGDNHNPGYRWRNKFNKNTVTISEEDGQKLCKWKVGKLVSLHTHTRKTDESPYTAGYGLWFSPIEVEHISDWVKYLK